MRTITVEPVLFGYVFALVMSSPLLQRYVVDQLSAYHNFTNGEDRKLCANDTNVSDNITRLENVVQTQASHWLLGLSLSSSVPSVFATFMYGSMSDATGRKPVLLVALFGAFIYFLIVSMTVTFGWPFYVIFLGSFVQGFTGSFGLLTGQCLAYVVDTTDHKTRSIRLGILEICIALSAAVSFFVSGIWLKNSGYMQPFWTCTMLLFLLCLYIAFFLPESLTDKREFNKFSCLVNAKRIKDFILAERGPYVNVCLGLLVTGFLFAVFDYFGSVTILFTKHDPLCWEAEMFGYYMATKTAFASAGIVFTFKVLAKCFVETVIAIIGCVCYILSNVIVGFAKTTAAMFISCIPAFLAAAAPPCIRSIASKMVEKHDEGALCSVIAVAETIAQLLSPVLINMLYPVGLNKLHAPGFVYFVQAGILLIPITLFLVIYYITKKKSHLMYSKMPDVMDGGCEEESVQVST